MVTSWDFQSKVKSSQVCWTRAYSCVTRYWTLLLPFWCKTIRTLQLQWIALTKHWQIDWCLLTKKGQQQWWIRIWVFWVDYPTHQHQILLSPQTPAQWQLLIQQQFIPPCEERHFSYWRALWRLEYTFGHTMRFLYLSCFHHSDSHPTMEGKWSICKPCCYNRRFSSQVQQRGIQVTCSKFQKIYCCMLLEKDASTDYSLVLSGCHSIFLLGEKGNPSGLIPQLSIYALHTAGLQVGLLLEEEGCFEYS